MSEKRIDEKDIPEIEYTCPYCGEKLGEDKSFCSKCGKYLGKYSKVYHPIEEEKARMIKWIIGSVAVVVFIVIYFFVLKKHL